MKWTLRHSVNPGDIGYLTYLHGTIYAREYGFDISFEGYVARGLGDFIEYFNPKKDRIWLAQVKRRIVGSIAIVGRSRRQAQLRWFFVHPAYRGHGIGRRLLREALRFCLRMSYKHVFLWITSELDAARHIYLDAGFRKTKDKGHKIWGKKVREERYDLPL